MTDTKIASVRFVHPAAVAGQGMVDRLDVSIDPDTKQSRLPGCIMTLIEEGRWLRISTVAGESLVPSSNIASVRVLYEDRIAAAKAKSTK